MSFLSDHFETPALLAHLLLVAAVAGLWIVSLRRRRRLLAPWPGILNISNKRRLGWQRQLAVRTFGLACLVIALAGPRWGSATETTKNTGRDLMLVLDVSRSMNAEQPSRLEKAIRSLRTLTDAKQLPAGTRVGLIVFAAKPWLSFPLTRDLDHLAVTLDALAGGELPSDVRADDDAFVSGTRMGAAIILAIESFPEAMNGEIVLLSDGDDPVADDEWQTGVALARANGIPIHSVAIGEPGVKATIPYRGDLLRHDGTIVTSVVQRDRLGKIARRTDGECLTLDRGELPLAGLLKKYWTARPATRTAETEVRPVHRFPWLLAALVALVADCGFASLPSRKRQRPEETSPPKQGRFLLRSPALSARHTIAALVAICLISAEPAGIIDLQRGQEAFARHDYAAAVLHFDKAQPLLADPGVAAFNRAAAHYRLGHFAAAAADYRRALSDDAIPAQRRVRAWFDLGNSLLSEAGTVDRRLLEESIAAYRQCLGSDPDGELKSDATYNLAIAIGRLQKVLPNEPPKGNAPNPNGSDTKEGKTPDSGTKTKTDGKEPNEKNGTGDPKPPADGAGSKKSASGSIVVLDRANPVAVLAAEMQRIAAERRRVGQTRDLEPLRGKDW